MHLLWSTLSFLPKILCSHPHVSPPLKKVSSFPTIPTSMPAQLPPPLATSRHPSDSLGEPVEDKEGGAPRYDSREDQSVTRFSSADSAWGQENTILGPQFWTQYHNIITPSHISLMPFHCLFSRIQFRPPIPYPTFSSSHPPPSPIIPNNQWSLSIITMT